MSAPHDHSPEIDARFPSGPWVGFFLQPGKPGRHMMELHLTFLDGKIQGEGRDRIGAFLIRGRFLSEDGSCWWTKSYIGLHEVHYKGFNEGQGIWGLWEIDQRWKGGFHIWPEGMEDPTTPRSKASADRPEIPVYEDAEADAVLVTVPA